MSELSPAQNYILDMLAQHGDCSRATIKTRLKLAGFLVGNRSLNALVQRGLVDFDDDGYFSLTAAGIEAIS